MAKPVKAIRLNDIIPDATLNDIAFITYVYCAANVNAYIGKNVLDFVEYATTQMQQLIEQTPILGPLVFNKVPSVLPEIQNAMAALRTSWNNIAIGRDGVIEQYNTETDPNKRLALKGVINSYTQQLNSMRNAYQTYVTQANEAYARLGWDTRISNPIPETELI